MTGTDDHNIRFPGSVNVKLELSQASVANLAAAFGIRPDPIGETEGPYDDLVWLVEKGVHMTIGKGDKGLYVRVMPVSGITPTMMNGDIGRSLHRLRKDLERRLPRP
jgi:hypothetical protein